MKFSQRIGITPIAKEPQISDIDSDLKNSLWNIYYEAIFKSILGQNPMGYSLSGIGELFAKNLWHNYFKLPIDSIPRDYNGLYNYLKNRFYKDAWYDVYNLIEESHKYLLGIGFFNESNAQNIEKSFNEVMEREFGGYRFIASLIAPITNVHEMKELEDAISSTDSFSALKGSNIHLRAALTKISDKNNPPDYRNSIKESISAVESLVKIIAQKPSAELSSAIDKIKGQIKIHGSLEQGFKKLYGYTSDEGGIRHALMDDPNCDFEDAKFMLISCSAFINYLIVKATKANISLI